jgi:hypothetical protein
VQKEELKPRGVGASRRSGSEVPPVLENDRRRPTSGDRGVDLAGIDLAGLVLRAPDVAGADLTRANLSETDLQRATLTNANLSSSNLQRAVLWEAVLANADLSAADLAGAVLGQADLTGATLTGADLTGVWYSKGTKWPAGFVPPSTAKEMEGNCYIDVLKRRHCLAVTDKTG